LIHNDLQARLAKAVDQLQREEGKSDQLRDSLAESARVHRLAMEEGNKNELIYLTREIMTEKKAAEDKVHALEKRCSREKKAAIQKLRGKDIEVMLQKAILHRVRNTVHIW